VGHLNLTEIFKDTVSDDAQFWGFSTDPVVQNRQVDASKAHRSSSNLASSSNFKKQQEQKDKDDADFATFTAVMDQINKTLEEISRQAQLALTDLGKELDKAKENLEQLKNDFDKNTIQLANGRKVYYDTNTNNFAYQDKQGKWHALKDDEDKAEAFEKARARNGLVSTKQGKIALDRYEAKINKGDQFVQTQQQRLEQIDRGVQNGTLDKKDAIKQKRDVLDKTKNFHNDIVTARQNLTKKGASVTISKQQLDNTDYKSVEKQMSPNDKMKNLFESDQPQDPGKSADLSITPKPV